MKRIFYFLFIISTSAYAQKNGFLGTDSSSLNQIKRYIQDESNSFKPVESFTSTQNKLLKEKYEAKVKAELTLLNSSLVITEGELYDVINSIFNKIIIANPGIPQNSKLVLYRSADFNAFTMGENVVFVNLGLLYYLKNEAEIALVLAHEIAHNTLYHSQASMIEKVKLETDDSLNDKIKSISKEEYGQVSALNALLVPRIFESKEQSRAHEYEADSLGMVYIKNAKFDVAEALPMFRVMESRTKDNSEIMDLNKCLNHKEISEIYAKEQAYKRTGSLGTFTKKDDDKLQAYLSSHPYDRDRFVKLARIENLDTTLENYKNDESPILLKISENNSLEIIETALKNKNFSQTFYFSCKHILKYPESEEGYKYLGITLRSLAFFKDTRKSGKYLMLQDPQQPEDIDRVCAFLFTLSPSECRTLAKKAEKNTEHPIEVINKMNTLLDFYENEDYQMLEPFFLSSYSDLQNSNFDWITKEVASHIYRTKQLKYLKPYIK